MGFESLPRSHSPPSQRPRLSGHFKKSGNTLNILHNIWVQETLGFVFWFLYGSYFEWFFHKHLFHSPKWIKRTFQSHTLTHHQIYKGDHTYTLAEGKEAEHVAMDWWALLAFLAFHFPLIGAVQLLTGWHCLWGGMLAIAAYYGIYEYFHWCMHVPNQRPFEKWAAYRFIREHHRVHHVHMLKNLNVILPLADLTLGTFKKETKKRDVPYARSTENGVAAALRPVKELSKGVKERSKDLSDAAKRKDARKPAG